MSERAVVHKKLIENKIAADVAGTIGPAFLSRVRELSFYVVFGTGTASGVITIEAAPHEAYAGTWASLQTVTWSAADKAHHVAITGVHLALRARISTVIGGGGSVSVEVVGN